MARLTQDDFSPVYMNVKNRELEGPKIVQWALNSPLMYEDIQIMITILQRREDDFSEWDYVASLKARDPFLSTNEEDLYGTDRFAEDGIVTTEETYSFEDCIDSIYEKIEEIVS